jgi:hemolysin III
MRSSRPLTLGEEIANALTHGAGLIASLIGVPLLVMTALAHGDIWRIAGCSVFGATLISLYAASTLYHAVPHPRAKRVLQVVDHAAIYLLIAGSYTPFTLGVLRGALGWTLFGIVWSLAAAGILFKSVLGIRFPNLSTALYLLMGWLAIIAVGPLTTALPTSGLALLATGGLLYTGGVVFFMWERPRFSHTLWHLFVLGGSVCHFLAVLWYVA